MIRRSPQSTVRRCDADQMSAEQVRAVQLDLLETFDRFCRDQDITYYLAYGTLLGAVRHRGFIPWDDDVDVMMPREDFDRFLAAWTPRPGAAETVVGSPGLTPGWPYPYAKLSDTRTAVHERIDAAVEIGVNLDVFPIDAYPDPGPRLRRHLLLLNVWRNVHAVHWIDAATCRSAARRTVLRLAKPGVRRVPVESVVGAFSRVATAHNAGSADDAAAGIAVGSYSWFVPGAALGRPVRAAFEHLMLPIPADAHTVLSTLFGDYHRLPPPSARVSHHSYTAYWRAPR